MLHFTAISFVTFTRVSRLLVRRGLLAVTSLSLIITKIPTQVCRRQVMILTRISHGSRVTRVIGQFTDGSDGSWSEM